MLETLVKAAAAESLPIDLAGAVLKSGWESWVLETRDGWIVRFPREHVDFEREVAVLRRLEGRLPAPIPRIEWVGQATPFMVYRKLTGLVFNNSWYEGLPTVNRDRVVDSLAEFLAAMHSSLSPEEIAELGILAPAPVDRSEWQSPAALRTEISKLLAAEASLRDPGPQVVMHDDFHLGNMVFDASTAKLAGVWDFSCVRLGTPSNELRYFVNDSLDLVERLVQRYAALTGHSIDLEVARVAGLVEHLHDAIETGDFDPLRKLMNR